SDQEEPSLAELGYPLSYEISLFGAYCFLAVSNRTVLMDTGYPYWPTVVPNSLSSNWLSRIRGSLGYGADSQSGFRVYECGSLTNLKVLGQYSGVSGAVDSDGRYAYVAGGLAGLTILDLGTDAGSAPEITSFPSNIRVLPGVTTNFFAGVAGSVPLTYQW